MPVDCTKSQEGVFLQHWFVPFCKMVYCTKSQEGVFLQHHNWLCAMEVRMGEKGEITGFCVVFGVRIDVRNS